MDAACTIQDSIHVFSLVRKYVSRILGTYQLVFPGVLFTRVARKIACLHADLASTAITRETRKACFS